MQGVSGVLPVLYIFVKHLFVIKQQSLPKIREGLKLYIADRNCLCSATQIAAMHTFFAEQFSAQVIVIHA